MEKEGFLLVIDAVFHIHTIGVVVTGRVQEGNIKKGDKLKISGANIEIATTCVKLEKFQCKISEATVGDYIGVVLSDVIKSDIQRGMLLMSAE